MDCLKRWPPGHMCHHPHRFTEFKVKSGMGNPDWNMSLVDIHFRKLLWMYWFGHARVKGNDQACVSEDLKCWGAWDTTCWRKAKDITAVIWRREVWKEEAFDDLPWKDEIGPFSIRGTLALFQRQCWGNLWVHTGFSERIHTTVLNWSKEEEA